MDVWHLLLDIVLLLSASLLFGGICLRFGQSPLVGYLLAGMLLGGPGGVELIHPSHEIDSIAELGVSLLLFGLGLEFSWGRLTSLGKKTLFSGFLQVIITATLGTGTALLFHLGITEAIAIGAMVALSSTACVLRVLNDQAQIDSSYGRNALAILLVQDIAVVPLAMLMSVLAQPDSDTSFIWPLLKILGMTAVLIVALYILLNFVAVRALGRLTLKENRELTVLLAVATGLGSAWAAHAAGISPAMGAFVAGMFLGNSPFATQIRADISSLRVVLLTLFFGAVGMVADPFWLIQNWLQVSAVVLMLLAGKTIIITAILVLLGKPFRIAVATGLCLSQIGEFAFVLGTIGKEASVLSDETYQLIVSSTIVTLFLSPYLVINAQRWGTWIERLVKPGSRQHEHVEPESDHPQPDFIIVGFGPAGQRASVPLQDVAERVLVLDLNSNGIKKAREFGFAGQVGDSSQTEVLEHAGAATAHTVIITVPHHNTALQTLEGVKALNAEARVFVRCRYQIHTQEFLDAGAYLVAGDEENVGDQLAASIREEIQLLDHLTVLSTEDQH
ncbi:Glutathione-regulated potassium-efflux system protein KefC [Polystyrenella longa]|uniref:Glutathione-regulated potassium-efflux system protein KefC n=1 Tax=Polystyrenella longa TaxID=2528007 RepID=A0A518CQC8_9PLAN|nr:cation:proton antiporter [Polystyrenella longa]QDU81436.1 Glutathione-regulated potassium-efflux system protein KefC [Polystyrenella longa]